MRQIRTLCKSRTLRPPGAHIKRHILNRFHDCKSISFVKIFSSLFNHKITSKMNTRELKRQIRNATARSAWAKGVKEYALELADTVKEWQEYSKQKAPTDRKELERVLLNGARTWAQYSEGGCALVYDCDIAERLCNPSELKRTKGGERNPNGWESWVDVQTRALTQAGALVIRCARQITRTAV